MKKSTTLVYICIVLAIINVFMILSCSRRTVQAPVYSYDGQPTALPVTCDVPLPEELNLAGEKVPLHRTDTKEALQKELIVNTYLHSHTIQILKNAPYIFSIIEPILAKNGVPEDFKYLAVIESKLDPQAESPVGAIGLWQIMKGTGEELGLEVNQEVDERYNIEKSTQAACDYLKKAYQRFGSWTMAAASYNAGTAMVTRQISIQKEMNYYDLLLGEETGRYVFRILALKQIMNHPELYHFQINTTAPIEKTETVKVSGPVSDWADFAKEHGISYKTLKRFNPWLRKSDLRNPERKTYEIRIPADPKQYR